MTAINQLLPPDYHTHNLLCKHAEGKPVDYAKAAAVNGVGEFAATDHCPTDVGFGIEHRMMLEQFPTYTEWVQEAQRANGVKVLFGVEADYYKGCVPFLEKMLNEHPFDIVLGSVHFLDYFGRRTLAQGNPSAIWKEYFSLIGEMADTRLYDIASHLDLPKRFGNAIPLAELREYALPALDKLAAAGMGLEINTSGLRHPPKECYPSLPLLTWARECGVTLAFGSDSHTPGRVGADFDHAIRLARSAGYTQYVRLHQRAKTAVDLPDIS